MPNSLTYTLPELARWLGLEDVAQVEALVAQGMPKQGDRFDYFQVANWLEDNAKELDFVQVQRCDHRGVVKTQAEVARAFGVSRSTVKTEWVPSGMPGRSGHYNLADIARWKSLRMKDPGTLLDAPPGDHSEGVADLLLRKREADARCKEAEAEKKERENALAEEAIVNVRDVERFLSELFTKQRDLFASLAEEVVALLPSKLKKEVGEDLTGRLEDRQRQLHRWATAHLTDMEREVKS